MGESGVPRYWALIILSVVYRLGGVVLLVLTLLSAFAFTSMADDSNQPVFPTLAPFPTLPPLPDFFNPQQPLPFPTIDAGQVTAQLTQAFGAFAALFVLVWGLTASVGLFALGQFLVLMMDHEYNMRVTAHGLETRAAKRG